MFQGISGWTNQAIFLNFLTGGKTMKKIAISLLALTLGVLLAVPAMAGPGSVEVTVPGDISLRMGAQVRMIPTSEIDRDFGLSDNLTGAQEARAAGGLRHQAVLSNSTRSHLTERAGAVKDSYIGTEDRLFFNFAKDKDWDVYMMLEVDTVLNSSAADRTDFALGRQSQQFGIERLNASFNIPCLSSRLRAGWDARGTDIAFGGMVYADDDPGIGLTGGAEGWQWSAWYIKKKELEGAYGLGSPNATGATHQAKDQDRTLMYGKLGREIDSTYLEGFLIYNGNHYAGPQVDQYVAALQGKGTYGIFKPMLEVAYAFGNYDAHPGRTAILPDGSVHDTSDADIKSWAAFGDVALDLSENVGIKKFEPHIGGYYLQGDDDPLDDDLEGFAPVTGISRFSPRFGTEQSISHDGNPLLGQIEYSMFPAYYGTTWYQGGGITGTSDLDNPGFVMVGGGLNVAEGNWSYKGNVMAMWFNEASAVEAYYTYALGLADVTVDEYMGTEWNNELSYKPYKAVTLKLGVTFLFPGDGAEDITQALDAYAREVPFAQGDSSNDISQRYAAEIIWFF
jgi:hypothetical protein